MWRQTQKKMCFYNSITSYKYQNLNKQVTFILCCVLRPVFEMQCSFYSVSVVLRQLVNTSEKKYLKAIHIIIDYKYKLKIKSWYIDKYMCICHEKGKVGSHVQKRFVWKIHYCIHIFLHYITFVCASL